MSQTKSTNRQWPLSERPKGEPTDRTLRRVEQPIRTSGRGKVCN